MGLVGAEQAALREREYLGRGRVEVSHGPNQQRILAGWVDHYVL